MATPKEKSALELALAVRRYHRMRNPANAYMALHKEWPSRIANIIDGILWSKIEPRSEKQIVADLRALQAKAAKRSAAVQHLIEHDRDAR